MRFLSINQKITSISRTGNSPPSHNPSPREALDKWNLFTPNRTQTRGPCMFQFIHNKLWHDLEEAQKLFLNKTCYLYLSSGASYTALWWNVLLFLWYFNKYHKGRHPNESILCEKVIKWHLIQTCLRQDENYVRFLHRHSSYGIIFVESVHFLRKVPFLPVGPFPWVARLHQMLPHPK